MFPLFLLILGLGAAPQIALIFVSTFFLVVIPTIAAFVSVPLSYREAADSFGASQLQMVRHVLLPAAIPQIFVGLRVAAGASILIMVAVEFNSGTQGIGYLIWHSWSLFLADRMYVGMVVTAACGVIITLLVGGLGRVLAPWAEEH
jgi:NitT/TauT family transport system permease protein/sulfonate transport system permease protein